MKNHAASAQIWRIFTFVFGSYTGMQPLGGVLLRVLRGQDHRRGLLRGHYALSLPCLRGKNFGLQQSKSSIVCVSPSANKHKNKTLSP